MANNQQAADADCKLAIANCRLQIGTRAARFAICNCHSQFAMAARAADDLALLLPGAGATATHLPASSRPAATSPQRWPASTACPAAARRAQALSRAAGAVHAPVAAADRLDRAQPHDRACMARAQLPRAAQLPALPGQRPAVCSSARTSRRRHVVGARRHQVPLAAGRIHLRRRRPESRRAREAGLDRRRPRSGRHGRPLRHARRPDRSLGQQLRLHLCPAVRRRAAGDQPDPARRPRADGRRREAGQAEHPRREPRPEDRPAARAARRPARPRPGAELPRADPRHARRADACG